MASPIGIEPTTYCLGGNRSILLSYEDIISNTNDIYENNECKLIITQKLYFFTRNFKTILTLLFRMVYYF